jgi:lysophospholipase L1-like esterase
MMVAGVIAPASQAIGQTQSMPVGIVEDPCPPPLERPAELKSLEAKGMLAIRDSQSAVVKSYLSELGRRRSADPVSLCVYKAANAVLERADGASPTVVFIGDSITDLWPDFDPRYFAGGFVGRGVGSQTSAQGLLRFQQDVVELHPKVVHILFGTNDIAGLGGPTTLTRIEHNLKAMAQLAAVNRIAVVIGTLPPLKLPGAGAGNSLTPNVRALNDWIRAFGKTQHIRVVDYFAKLSDGAGDYRPVLTTDGVHPSMAGYQAMEPLAAEAIRAAALDRGQ